MKRKILLTAVMLLLLASVACAAQLGDFKSQGLDGEVFTQEILGRAKLTVFNVWGTFCPPCLREMPDLGELAAELKDEGVQIVGLLCDWSDRSGEFSMTQISKAKNLVEQTRANYLHLLLTDAMEESFGAIRAVPQTYFVNSKGEILGAVTGAQSKDKWRALISEMLERCGR